MALSITGDARVANHLLVVGAPLSACPLHWSSLMVSISLHIPLSLVILSIFIFGCDDTPPPSNKCEYHTDCPIPERCIQGSCRLECRVSTDCDAGSRCFEGVCYARPDVCRDDEECAPFQEVCDPRILACVPPDQLTPPLAGSSSGGSSMGGSMNGGESSGGSSMGGSVSGGEMASGSIAGGEMAGGATAGGDVSGGSSMGGSTTGGMSAGGEMGGSPPVGQGQYGDDCRCPSDCASGYCVTNKMKSSRTCSTGCDADAECPGIDTCLQAQIAPASSLCPDTPTDLPPPGTVVGVCAPNETAFPCSAPNECTSGICLTPPQVVPWTSPQAVCTMACSSDLKCPTGYRCDQAGGVDESVCVPIPDVRPCADGMATSCGGVCSVPVGRQEIDLVICLNAYQQTPGYCTCTCVDASDCPTGFACSRIGDTGDPTRPGVCIPFEGASCPESSRGVEQCLSTTCLIDEEDQSLNRCTTFCLNNADCPAAYDCVSVGSDSVCIPR